MCRRSVPAAISWISRSRSRRLRGVSSLSLHLRMHVLGFDQVRLQPTASNLCLFGPGHPLHGLSCESTSLTNLPRCLRAIHDYIDARIDRCGLALDPARSQALIKSSVAESRLDARPSPGLEVRSLKGKISHWFTPIYAVASVMSAILLPSGERARSGQDNIRQGSVAKLLAVVVITRCQAAFISPNVIVFVSVMPLLSEYVTSNRYLDQGTARPSSNRKNDGPESFMLRG